MDDKLSLVFVGGLIGFLSSVATAVITYSLQGKRLTERLSVKTSYEQRNDLVKISCVAKN
jgi:hypothetical protein